MSNTIKVIHKQSADAQRLLAQNFLSAILGCLRGASNSRRATYGYDQRLEVHGSKGMLRAGNVLQNTVELANGSGQTRGVTEPFFLERYRAAYVTELTHFISCLEAGTSPTPTAEDGLKAQLIADAAAQSLACKEIIRL